MTLCSIRAASSAWNVAGLVLLLEVEPMDLSAEPRAQALDLERRLAGRGGRFIGRRR